MRTQLAGRFVAEDAGNRTIAERNRLVLDNLGLVYYFAQKFHPVVPLEDKIQEGTLGLIRAAEKFDETRGIRFGSYASWWIRQMLQRMGCRNYRGMKVPPLVELTIQTLNKVAQDLYQSLGRKATAQELAIHLNLNPKKVALYQSCRMYPPSVEDMPRHEVEASKTPWFSDEKTADDLVFEKEKKKQISELLGSLKARDRYVVMRRLGLAGDPASLVQIGKECGFCRERARQVWMRAIQHLQWAARGKGLETFW